MDNYTEFMQRLKSAEASLKSRQDALGNVQAIVSSAMKDNDYGHREWAGRRVQLEELTGSQGTADRTGLSELLAVAKNMESVFEARCVRVGSRLTAIQNRLAEIARPLRDLQISKEKLASSRRVAEERENLSRAVQGLAGTAEGVETVTLDAGLQADVKAAREAVVLAEALLEAKGD